MAITTDITTAIGQVRLEAVDDDANTYMFEDDRINYFISRAAGNILLAARFALAVKLRKITSQPTSTTILGHSETYSPQALQAALKDIDERLQAQGIDANGDDVCQAGFIEVGRDENSWNKAEFNKAARGEDY
jgi:hypothetical protein